MDCIDSRMCLDHSLDRRSQPRPQLVASEALQVGHLYKIRSKASDSASYSKEPILRVNSPELTILVKLHPSNVIPDTFNLVSRKGRIHHGKIGLTTSTWKCCCNIPLPASWISNAQDLRYPVAQTSLDTRLGIRDCIPSVWSGDEGLALYSCNIRRICSS
ncbi:Uncharacterized protein GBIM_15992 [Gryllus bimaculatus]|nr:Uncharacterized protein GBIM_15992 [Gryllus bimaculatus]